LLVAIQNSKIENLYNEPVVFNNRQILVIRLFELLYSFSHLVVWFY